MGEFRITDAKGNVLLEEQDEARRKDREESRRWKDGTLESSINTNQEEKV